MHIAVVRELAIQRDYRFKKKKENYEFKWWQEKEEKEDQYK